MSLRFRYLELVVHTDQGRFGVELDFPDGLVVLRAGNSRGKSTCVRALIYGLGLEGMLGPGHEIPLPHAVKDFIETGHRDTAQVTESWVRLEVENGNGERIALQRAIVAEVDQHLIRVWKGPAFTDSSEEFSHTDYFVRRGGAAQRERGFHTFLESFVGWDLPTVTRYGGEESKLYFEVLLPLLYVDQKHGWSSTGASFPTYFRIQDAGARATEFLLDFDAYEIAERRRELHEREDGIRSEWLRHRGEIASLVDVVNGIPEGIPETPVIDSQQLEQIRINVPIRSEWILLKAAIAQLEKELADLSSAGIPSAGEVADTARQEVAQTLESLAAKESGAERFATEIESLRKERQQTRKRLEDIEEDLQRNKDLLTLQKLGSEGDWNLSPEECPVCLRPLSRSLLEISGEREFLTVEEQTAFLQEQREVFRVLDRDAGQRIERVRRQMAANDEEVEGLRRRVRDLRATLSSTLDTPSIEHVGNLTSLQSRVDQLRRIDGLFEEELGALYRISAQWEKVRQQIAALPDENVSSDDQRKLHKLRQIFIELLDTFELRSVSPETVELSQDSYRPIHEGFDLEFDFSASDTIRTVWAYRLSMLELARTEDTNHLGFLIFDEPRQQNADRSSVHAFMKRVSNAEEYDQQVIVATSGEVGGIEEMLDGLPHEYHDFDSWIISKRG